MENILLVIDWMLALVHNEVLILPLLRQAVLHVLIKGAQIHGVI